MFHNWCVRFIILPALLSKKAKVKSQKFSFREGNQKRLPFFILKGYIKVKSQKVNDHLLTFDFLFLTYFLFIKLQQLHRTNYLSALIFYNEEVRSRYVVAHT